MFRLFECCALSFFERFVLSFSLKIERFVSDSAEIWICGLYTKDTILVFSNSEKIVINECVHAFSDIIDFSVNEKKSYKSSTSTGSIIGRGIVGGVLLGGVGALAGATTAKKNTIEKVDGYTIRITMRGFDKPDIKIHTMFEDYMEEVTSVLKKVIDYNEKKYNI